MSVIRYSREVDLADLNNAHTFAVLAVPPGSRVLDLGAADGSVGPPQAPAARAARRRRGREVFMRAVRAMRVPERAAVEGTAIAQAGARRPG